MLWPHCGWSMCQGLALLLVPDIPLTDKKTVKKFKTYINIITIILWLNLTLQNEMSVMSGAVYRLNIDYLYQAKICMSIHIPRFQSLYQLSTWGGLCLAYSGTSVLSPLPWGHVDLCLCGLCWSFLSVFPEDEWVSAKSAVYWQVLMVLKELFLVQDIHVEFLLGKEDLMWWVYHVAEVVLELEHWENHQFSCRHSWPSSP